jgi:hypothetical protein
MLKTHFDTMEKVLLATSTIVRAAGHDLHKGTPREMFIRDFLSLHLASNVGIGSGEIIDSDSIAGAQRRQIDTLLYQHSFPRIHFGAGLNAFLSESVIGIIEVKSTINKEALRQVIRTTHEIKALKRNISSFPPVIYSYLVGYSGPASMNQIYTWIAEIHSEDQTPAPDLPHSIEERVGTPSPSIDVVIVLGKGMLYYDTSPVGLLANQIRQEHPDIQWLWLDQEGGNLLFLHLHLTQVIGSYVGTHVDLLPYLKGLAVPELRRGTWTAP